jgi:hypothetical protein
MLGNVTMKPLCDEKHHKADTPTLLVGVQGGAAFMENLDLEPPYDSAMPLMGVYPKELKTLC